MEEISDEVEKMNSSYNNNNNNNVCRQSSTRWTPTTEQIKLLKELYYINGVRSPTADQIQAICARLLRYGKIEGKNVFYWFQNHKARERHKNRLTPTPTPTPTINGICCSNSSSGGHGVVSNGGGHVQLMGGFQYGADITMENKFKECSISGGGGGGFNGSPPVVGGGGGTYISSTYGNSNLHDRIISTDQDHVAASAAASDNNIFEIQTLPLFPMHNNINTTTTNNNNNNNDHFNYYPSTAGFYSGGHCWSSGGGVGGGGGGGNGASLELTLNSYGYGCYSHNY